jgi:hypothetical protein
VLCAALLLKRCSRRKSLSPLILLGTKRASRRFAVTRFSAAWSCASARPIPSPAFSA